MNFTYEFCLDIYRSVLSNTLFSWSIMAAKAIAFFILIVHYFKIYYKSFSERIGYRIKVYDVIRPLIYILLIAFYPLFLNVLDDVTGSFEDSFISYKDQGKLIEVNANVSTQDETITNAPPPADPSEITAKSTAGILTYLANPSLIIFKILDFLVYLLDSVIFIFAIILRFAFLFILRFFAPFAIVASIFEHYNKFFWNWLKIYLIVFASVFVFFVINTFCDIFYRELINVKAMYPGSMPGSVGMSLPTDQWSYMASTMLFCIVLVKTALYTRSIKFMYQIFRNS